MSTPAPAPSAWAWWGSVATLLTLALLGIWVPSTPPGMDMPIHLVTADVLAHPAAYAGRYTPHLALSSQGFVWLMVPALALGAALETAAKLALTLLLALSTLGFGAIGFATGARRPVGALFGVTWSASWVLAMGFANFALAVPVAALAVAATLHTVAKGTYARCWRWPCAIGALLLLTAALHIIVAGLAIVQVGAVIVLTAERDERTARLLRLVGAAVPAVLYVFGVAVVARTTGTWQDVAEQLGAHRLPLATQLQHWLDGPWGGFSALGGALVAATLLVQLGEGTRWRRLAWATLAFWTLVYALLPWHAQGWAYAQPRVLVFAWAIPAALGTWGARPNRRLAAVTALAAVHLALWGDGAVSAARQVEAVRAGFGVANPGPATTLTASAGFVASAPDVVHPLLHASAYTIANGGWLNDRYRFNGAIHSARPVEPERTVGEPLPQFAFRPLAACASEQACAHAIEELADLAAIRARSWPSLVIVGAPPPLLHALAARGFRARPGSAPLGTAPGAVVSLEPATLQLTLAAPEGFAAPLSIAIGYPATLGWFDGRSRPAAPFSGEERIQMPGLPAGRTTVALLSGDEVLAEVEVVLQAGSVTTTTLRWAPSQRAPNPLTQPQ